VLLFDSTHMLRDNRCFGLGLDIPTYLPTLTSRKIYYMALSVTKCSFLIVLGDFSFLFLLFSW
jgi:hypothetical protein